MSEAVRVKYCGFCAERIGRLRDIEDISDGFVGRCSNCGSFSQLVLYEVGLTHSELARRRRNAKAAEGRKGGGERARAGRRAG